MLDGAGCGGDQGGDQGTVVDSRCDEHGHPCQTSGDRSEGKAGSENMRLEEQEARPCPQRLGRSGKIQAPDQPGFKAIAGLDSAKKAQGSVNFAFV